MRKLFVFTIAALVILGAATGAIAARHGRHGTAKRTATVKISTRTVKGLGKILVDAKGHTLYMFVPDKRKKVTCVKVCAQLWPPVKVAKGEKIVAEHGVKRALLGRDKNPSGGFVVTYAKWPLYTYVTDTKPGQVTGQALNSAGGLWYVLSPSGKVMKKKVR